MDQEIAKRLLLEGATLVLLGVPTGTEFGIDLKSWRTGNKFMGVKMIPPGIHMVYYSATDMQLDISPRISFFYSFKPSEFIVRKWNPASEEFIIPDMSDEELNIMKRDLLNLDRHLGVYPFEILKKWKKLCDKLTDEVILRLMPESGVIRSALELVAVVPEKGPQEKRRSGRTSAEKEEDLLPNMKPFPGSEPNFIPIPIHSFPEGASPADITKHSMDSSYMLETMINNLKKPCDLLAEVQFSFLCFLVGLSLESFEHWKKLVDLICRSEIGLFKWRELFSEFLPIIECQLYHIPEDFLVDIVDSNNVIYIALRELFRNMESGDNLEGRMRCEAERLKHRLTAKFSWDFEELDKEEGEDAPVVVDLDGT